MEENPVSRAWLESLSTAELIKLADNYGVDIPAGLERIFIIEEVLECVNAEKQTKEDIIVNPSYSEAVLLPKQYNISYIEVIIRDPLWAFVFWEIKGHDREMHENARDFKGYCLRVIPLNEGETEQQARANSFTVLIDSSPISARYLGFAEHSSKNSGRYLIKLNVIHGDTEYQIATSQIFNLPKLHENESIAEMSGNPLVRLSGAQDLSITKVKMR
ncbi:MAG: DUF4912 domain-containing protein [Treponema sp.]|nr:DUF4912 domain-containing protein [Treponema sp.]